MSTRQEYDRQRYLANQEKKKAQVKAYREANPEKVHASQVAWRERPESRELIKELNKQRYHKWGERIDGIALHYGCQNPGCPSRSHGYVPQELDFHHLQKKEFQIAALGKQFGKRIAKEINKCVILCANCHRRHHAGLIAVDESMLCHVDEDLNISA